MKIIIYQKDQGAHKTNWKEFASFDEDKGYSVIVQGSFLIIKEFPSEHTVYMLGSENFYCERK